VAAYYLDTSALVKRYLVETGTSFLLALTDYQAGNDLITARLTGPEMYSAIWRKRRTGEATSADALRALNLLGVTQLPGVELDCRHE
jgi:predicted nucleic acid-binding protein